LTERRENAISPELMERVLLHILLEGHRFVADAGRDE